MKPVATSSDQLTSQTRRLSLLSPPSDDPGSLVPVEDGKPFSPAIPVVADAQPAAMSTIPSLLQEAACPASSHSNAGLVTQAEGSEGCSGNVRAVLDPPCLESMPNEVLFQIMGFLDVSDLLSASRVSIDRPKSASVLSYLWLVFDVGVDESRRI